MMHRRMNGIEMPPALTRRALLGSALTTPMLAAPMLAAPAIAADAPVRIGVLVDESGPYHDIGGPGSAEAARMAAEDFGGSVLGRPIEIALMSFSVDRGLTLRLP